MERTAHFQLKIHKIFFLLFCGPIGYWFLVTVPIDLVVNSRITEFTAIILLVLPIFLSFCIFLGKFSFFSIKLEKLFFTLTIVSFLSCLGLSFFYASSTVLVILLFITISNINALITPYLFAKIFNLVTINTKIHSICEIFIAWFGGGVIFLILFTNISPEIAFILASLSIFTGIIIQYIYQIKPKNFTQIQLLPLNYRSIANGNVIGIDAVLILFWSVAIIIVKEFRSSSYSIGYGRFDVFWTFMVINVITALVFYIINKRLNLKLLYYIDYLLISFSIIIVLFWKPLIPLALIFVSSFGIVTFSFSMPDLMDVNKGIIGLSFMSFFQILLLIFPLLHIIIYFMDTALTDTFASYLLIIIIIAMSLISGIKFLPVPVNIEYLIISHNDGIPLYSIGTASKDEKIISGLLTGILTILNTGGTDKIKTIDHGDKKIMISLSTRVFGVIVCDRYSKSVGYKLQEIVDLFEAGFDKILDLNSFNVQLFKKLPPLLVQKIDIFFSD